MLGDSDTGSLKKFLFFFFTFSTFYLFGSNLYWHHLFWPSDHITPLCSFLDESEQEGEKERPLTREEEDLDIIRSWVEVGDHPARQEGEAKELLAEVNIFPCLSLSS